MASRVELNRGLSIRRAILEGTGIWRMGRTRKKGKETRRQNGGRREGAGGEGQSSFVEIGPFFWSAGIGDGDIYIYIPIYQHHGRSPVLGQVAHGRCDSRQLQISSEKRIYSNYNVCEPRVKTSFRLFPRSRVTLLGVGG